VTKIPDTKETMREARAKVRRQSAKLGKELKALRISKGLMAMFVAKVLGISNGHLSDLESGNRVWSKKLVESYLSAIGEKSL
jgi:hypothetical protein